MGDLRDDFLLRPDVAFLNHGSYGACPRPVFETYQGWQRELEAQPVEFLGRRAPTLLAEARRVLASYLGARSDEVVYFPNVTHALNVVARSIHLGPGDEIVTTDHEYGALDRTWRFVCERSGATIVRATLPRPLDEPDEVVDAIWSCVTERTRAIFVSHITSPTAAILPIRPLIARARRQGVVTIVDGAHAPGQIDLDLDDLGADFYGGNCHKWLCAPKGAGFLFARRESQHLLDPLVVSWGWRPDDPGPSRFIDEHERQGTNDLAAYLSVPAAIAYQRENDWATVRAACHRAALSARQRIEGLGGSPPVCLDPDRWCGQMVTVPLPSCDVREVKRRLYDECLVEVPVLRWNDRPFIRVSIQAYNSVGDVDRLVAGLSMILSV